MGNLDRRNLIPHWWQGRPEDLPRDPTYLLTSDKLNANNHALAKAIAKTLIEGSDCVEGTSHYGSSTTTECRITLPDDYSEIGDIMLIGDATRQWVFQIVYENEIKFNDDDLIKGSALGNDYNTIKDNLIIMTLSKTKLALQVTKDQICLGGFDKALDGDVIRVDHSAAQTIKEKLALFDVEHKTDGVHKDGFLENSMLDKNDVLISQAFINKIKNGFFYINDAVSRDYWDDLLTPTVTPTANPCGAFPAYYCKLDTNQLNEGIKQAGLKGFEKDKPITFAVYAKGQSGGEAIKVTLLTGSASTHKEITLTDVYVLYTHTFTPDSQCGFDIQIVANTASSITFYIACVAIYSGDVVLLPDRAPRDYTYDMVLQDTFHVEDITVIADSLFAQWDLLKDIQILQIDIKCLAAVNNDVTIRLTDGATNYDTTISNGNSTAQNTTKQNYNKAATMQLKVLSNSSTTGDHCNITIQYRIR